jgi:demethylmenaquinone methyltransferase/2-methoxy-6-polyprenyl-1,4-benzoquinol methylase
MVYKAQAKYPLKEFYSQIFRSYDLVNRLFTFGMDKRWRKNAARKCLSFNPGRVIDLCCGTGDAIITIAELSNRSIEIVGYDFNKEMLDIAKEKVSKRKLENIEFIQGDAASIPFEKNSFDCITIAFGFRNLTYKNPNMQKHLQEMARVLKESGRMIILESGIPSNTITRFFYRFYLRVFLVLIGGLISGNRKAYKYLAESSENFYSKNEIEQLLGQYGFTLILTEQYFIGSANLFVAQKRSA